jgi:hypothetical protein
VIVEVVADFELTCGRWPPHNPQRSRRLSASARTGASIAGGWRRGPASAESRRFLRRPRRLIVALEPARRRQGRHETLAQRRERHPMSGSQTRAGLAQVPRETRNHPHARPDEQPIGHMEFLAHLQVRQWIRQFRCTKNQPSQAAQPNAPRLPLPDNASHENDKRGAPARTAGGPTARTKAPRESRPTRTAGSLACECPRRDGTPQPNPNLHWSGRRGEVESCPSEEDRSHRPWLAEDARPRIVLAL